MDAAQALFVEKGVGATSVDHIVAAAGVAKGTFYHHFVSKDAMLGALQDRFVAGFCAHIRAAQDRLAPTDWHGRVRAWVDAGIEGYFDRVALHDVIFHDYRPEERRGLSRNQVVDELSDFLAAGHEAGAWVVMQPYWMAVMLFNAMHGACDEALLQGTSEARTQLGPVLHDFFGRAVGAR